MNAPDIAAAALLLFILIIAFRGGKWLWHKRAFENEFRNLKPFFFDHVAREEVTRECRQQLKEVQQHLSGLQKDHCVAERAYFVAKLRKMRRLMRVYGIKET